MTSPTPSEDPSKKPRAKHACRTCNTRRVRCDVMETKPCSNCVASGSACEVLPSRRGRYVMPVHLFVRSELTPT